MQNRKLFIYCGITATLLPAHGNTFATHNKLLKQQYGNNKNEN